MKIFRFEKWFFDILTRGKDYIIIFHTITEFFGFRLCFIEVDIARFKGSGWQGDNFMTNTKLKILSRKGHSIATDRGDILIEPGGGGITLSLQGIEMELNFSPQYYSGFDLPGMSIRTSGRRSLRWNPLYLRAMVSGRISMEGESIEIDDSGYADYLISNLLPLNVPVQKLYWGRLHSKTIDLSYSYALNESQGKKWCLMIIHAWGKTKQVQKMEIRDGESEQYDPPGITCPASYTLEASCDTCHVLLSVEHISPAIVSAFAENPSSLGKWKKTLLKRMSRNPRGIKFFSIARMEITIEGKTEKLEDLFMIDEIVVFS